MYEFPSEIEAYVRREKFQDLESAVSGFLAALRRSPALQGRFLNTLSYIEHRGTRYLLLSHQRATMSEVVLKHILEEARHAFALRRMGEKISGLSYTYSCADMLAPASAKMYFARLVAAVTAYCRDVEEGVVLPYLYISGAIEVR